MRTNKTTTTTCLRAFTLLLIGGLLCLVLPVAAAALDHFERGLAAHAAADFNTAIQAFEEAVAGDPGNSDYHYWLGVSYGRAAEQASWFQAFNLAQRTREALEQAVRLDPANRAAVKDLLEFYRQAPAIVGGDPDKAASLEQKLARLERTGSTHPPRGSDS